MINIKKQQGATLITSMMMLTIMSIIGISATKVSTLDLLVANNDQQKMLLFQKTENTLTTFTTISNLNLVFGSNGFTGNVSGNALKYVKTSSPQGFVETITDIQTILPCHRQGAASSIGAGAPQCDLYDFEAKGETAHSGAKDRHHRGAAKMVPSTSGKGSLL